MRDFALGPVRHGGRIAQVGGRAPKIKFFTIVCGAVALSACSAANDTTGSSVSTQVPTESGATVYPFDAAFRTVMGADLAEIYSAVLLKQREVYKQCMTSAGWQVTDQLLDEMYVHDPNQSVGATDLERFERDLANVETGTSGTITSTSGSNSPAGPEPTAEESAASGQCQDEAYQQVPNPNGTLTNAINRLENDAWTRANADPLLQAAAAERASCIAAAGYTGTDTIDSLIEMLSRTAEDATLITKVRQEFDAIRPCLLAYETAWNTALLRAQQDILSNDPAAMSAALSGQQGALDGIKDQLQQVQTTSN